MLTASGRPAVVADADVRSVLASVDAPMRLLARSTSLSHDANRARHLAVHQGVVTVVQSDEVDDLWWLGDVELLLADADP